MDHETQAKLSGAVEDPGSPRTDRAGGVLIQGTWAGPLPSFRPGPPRRCGLGGRVVTDGTALASIGGGVWVPAEGEVSGHPTRSEMGSALPSICQRWSVFGWSSTGPWRHE